MFNVYLLTHCLLSYLGICQLSSSVTSHQWLLYHDCSLFMRESPNIFCGGTRYFLLWLRAASRLSCVCADRRLLAPALRLSGTGGRREAAGCGWCGAPWAGVSQLGTRHSGALDPGVGQPLVDSFSEVLQSQRRPLLGPSPG